MRCGQPIDPWWDLDAFPFDDAEERYRVWWLTSCSCGYTPSQLGAPPPKKES